MLRSRFARTIGLGMTIAALGASTAGAEPTDLRTPDAVAAGQQRQATTQYTPSDVRTPDAVAAGPATTGPGLDMRTPDVKDHGEGRGTFSAPDVTVVKVIDPAPTATGFDWGDAGIGAAGLLGLALMALGGTAIVAHRRQSRTPTTV